MQKMADAPPRNQCNPKLFDFFREGTAPANYSSSATIWALVSDGLQARRYLVSGLVQGVGFRFFVQHVAEGLHVNGWVRNLRDGRVEVVASGMPEQLAKLRASLERGPRFATVRSVDESEADLNSVPAGHFMIEETD
jgi:acylphosphatase